MIDVDLSVDRIGSGDNILVLIHPYPANKTYFDRLHGYLPENWQAILPDLPGFGETPAADKDSLTMREMAIKVKEIIPNHDKLVVGGVSMGGYITMAFIREYPELADAYILANTRDGPDADGGAGRKEVVKKIQNGERDGYIEELLPKLLAESNLENDDIVSKVREMISTASDAAIMQTSKGMGMRPDSSRFMQNVVKPMLLVTGTDDKITGVDTMRSMETHYRQAELHTVNQAGHYAFFENPQQSSKIIKQFLSQL